MAALAIGFDPDQSPRSEPRRLARSFRNAPFRRVSSTLSRGSDRTVLLVLDSGPASFAQPVYYLRFRGRCPPSRMGAIAPVRSRASDAGSELTGAIDARIVMQRIGNVNQRLKTISARCSRGASRR